MIFEFLFYYLCRLKAVERSANCENSYIYRPMLQFSGIYGTLHRYTSSVRK